MPLDLKVQLDIIIWSIVSGIITGLLFDIYRIIRGNNMPKIILAIEDVLFWILCTIVIFTFLLYINYAFLGPYVYVFIVISILTYLKFLSPFIIRVERNIIDKITSILRIGSKNFIYPIKIILSKMGSKNK